jgi:senataxin
MHPCISIFPNLSFYDGKISDAPSVTERDEKKYLPGSMFGPYSFVNIEGGREESDELCHSRKNLIEVVVIEEILRNLRKSTRSHPFIQKENFYLPYFSSVEELDVSLY